MYARKLLAASVTAALTCSAVALTAGSASAAVDPDDTSSFTPVVADLIGVGSDTSQNTLKRLAEGWNASSPAPSFKIATFAATGGGTIPLPTAAVNRPNGSGAGKSTLYGAGNNPDVDFARSSSANSSAESAAGLQAFPFALDTLVMAVSNSVPSNAPAALTNAQIVGIYNGSITNWSEIGGTAGVIAPKIPQAGSGTRSFFVSQLKSLNGGVDVALAASVVEVQEHDDTTIKSNPNAVAPFSEGRAGLLGSTLRLETGFRANRALYNVVRGTDVGNAGVLSVFGKDGYFCSTDARPLIEASGFKQLATSDFGGVCGAPTQSASSNFTLNQRVVTTTNLAVSSTSARSARLVATVTGSTSPAGTVSFFEGETAVATNVPLTSGQAVATLTGVTPGAHTYRAVFTPQQGSFFDASEDEGTGSVKTSSTIAESFATTVKAGKKAKGTITVTLAGVASKATGTVRVLKGSKVLASKALTAGKAVITLPKLTTGVNKLKVVWAGNGVAAGATKAFTIKQTK